LRDLDMTRRRTGLSACPGRDAGGCHLEGGVCNAAARALLNSSDGSLSSGCLRSTDGSDALLQTLIVSCKREAQTRNGPGGGISIRTGPRRSLRVTVTPLRAKGTVAELPWLGLQIPVAIVTLSAPSTEKSLN